MHPPVELQRLKALTALRILDTAPEAIFDHLTNVAARAFNAPIALISLVDTDRQWFKACIGLDTRETGRDVAFCDYAIRSGGAMVIPDATQDARFRDNPLVTGAPHIRFYAGAPLTLSTGERLGTLCIIDSHPRSDFNAQDRALLEAMAGSVTAALEMRRDISAFAALERERDRKKELLAQAETIAGLGRWSLDAATRTTTWSPQLYKIFGLDPDSPSPGLQATLDTYQPEDRAALKALVGRALTTGEPFEIQARITRPDGELRQVSTRGSCRFDPDGAIETVFGFVLDITDLKLADEQIRRNEAQLRFLTENTSDVIFRSSPEEGITWISPSCRRVLGYDPGELIGTTGVSLIHPDDVPNLAALRAARFAGQPDPAGHTLQARVRRADGSWIWMQENPTVIRDTAGAPIEIINVMRDVSAQRNLEAELLAARNAAEAAAQVKTDFMANMSHEIRTPLTAILGFTSMLAAHPNLDAKATTCVARVEGAGKALLSIVNDVLDFSKLEAGQFEIRPRQTSPTEVLTDTLLMFTPQAEEKGLGLELELQDLPASLTLDPDRLRQILLNLISNAVKFTDAGSVKLQAHYNRAGARLHIGVQDTGAGLTPGEQTTLFKRFSQVDGSSTRQHGGTGLGLAICKGFAEAMGGPDRRPQRAWRGRHFLLRYLGPHGEHHRRSARAGSGRLLRPAHSGGR